MVGSRLRIEAAVTTLNLTLTITAIINLGLTTKIITIITSSTILLENSPQEIFQTKLFLIKNSWSFKEEIAIASVCEIFFD